MTIRSRRPTSAIEKAEALFKEATAKPAETVRKQVAVPAGKETVTLRIDRDVLAHFQEDGPGWQDRLNASLRKAAGL